MHIIFITQLKNKKNKQTNKNKPENKTKTKPLLLLEYVKNKTNE